MNGSTARQFTACRTRQMPKTCVTIPHNTIRSAFWVGVMICSHTPETTRPIAKPDSPEVKPPKKAAAIKRARVMLSIGRSRTEGTGAWRLPSGGEAARRIDRQHGRPRRRALLLLWWDRAARRRHGAPPDTEEAARGARG